MAAIARRACGVEVPPIEMRPDELTAKREVEAVLTNSNSLDGVVVPVTDRLANPEAAPIASRALLSSQVKFLEPLKAPELLNWTLVEAPPIEALAVKVPFEFVKPEPRRLVKLEPLSRSAPPEMVSPFEESRPLVPTPPAKVEEP